MTAMLAIRTVLAAYRSTDAHITEEQITAAWAEYEAVREYIRLLEGKLVTRGIRPDTLEGGC